MEYFLTLLIHEAYGLLALDTREGSMRPSRVTYFLAGLLLMGHQGLLAQDRSSSHLLFENEDFKVYSVKNPEDLPSISQAATFGVMLVRERYQQVLLDPSGMRFGPSGRQSIINFGTPEGVVPLLDKQRFLSARADVTWVVPKFKALITEPVFRKDLPAAFTESVRIDLFAIAFVADSAATGGQPTKKQLALSRAAFDDLIFKSRWFSFFNDSSSAPTNVCVTARTLKEGQEIKYWTIWYVPLGWEGDKDHTLAFDKQSSPTIPPQCIPPGNYKMWATQKNKESVRKVVPVGDNPSPTKEVDLEVP
jgi:hypothetical protein